MSRVLTEQNGSINSAPFVLQPHDARQLGQVDTRQIITALRKHGAVLLRGIPSSLEEFQMFTGTMCEDFHEVGTRRAVEEPQSDGHTSEVPRKNFNLFAHSEGTYRPFPPPPELCFFNCVRPPSAAGGETLLVDGVRFLDKLPDELRQRFARQGIIYQATWDNERWQTEFQVDSLEQLDQLLLAHPQCSYQMQGNLMTVRCRVPAIQQSLGGLSAFANGLLAHLPAITHPRWQDQEAYSKPSNHVYFGDGEEINDSVINSLIDIQDEIVQAHRWQADDLLILDNKRVMHGRRMTEGDCERRIRSRFGQLKGEFKAPAGISN